MSTKYIVVSGRYQTLDAPDQETSPKQI